MAAPQHKIKQCIQRSALFPIPGRAERDAGGAKRRSAERVGSGDRVSGVMLPDKFAKIKLKSRIFCNFAN